MVTASVHGVYPCPTGHRFWQSPSFDLLLWYFRSSSSELLGKQAILALFGSSAHAPPVAVLLFRRHTLDCGSIDLFPNSNKLKLLSLLSAHVRTAIHLLFILRG